MTFPMLAAWLHDLNPFLWRISGEFGIRWYGLAYLAGFAVAWWWLAQLSKRGYSLIPAGRVGDAMVPLVMGVVLGGRLGYVLVYKRPLLWTFSDHLPWWGVLEINKGGMASHGGIAGVILATIWIAHRWRDGDGVRRGSIPALHALDLVGAVCPVGLGFGRIANFINGELLGEIVAKPGAPSPWWSVKFPQELVSGHPCERSPDQQAALETLASKFVGPRESLEDGYSHLIAIVQNHASSSHQEVMTKLEPLLAARYPSQLLQAATDGPILLAVLWWIWRKPRTPGIIGCWFMITYGVMRIITEVWRLPDTDVGDPRILGLSRGQWLSVAMVLVGFVGIAIVKARAKRLDIAPLGGWGVKKMPA